MKVVDVMSSFTETAFHEDLGTNFMQCSGLSYRKSSRDVLQAVWLCIVWSIWKIINNVIFCSCRPCIEEVVESVKFRFWVWLHVRYPNFRACVFSNWAQCLQYCIEL